MIHSTRTCGRERAVPLAVDVVPAPNVFYWGGPNLYVNLTSRCSSACTFCLADFTDDLYGYDLRLSSQQEPEVADLVSALEEALRVGTPEEVVFTGLGEPTLRLGVILGAVRWLAARRIPTRLDTNGHAALLHPGRDVVRELVDAGLRAVSVSLNAHDETTYDLLCRPTASRAYPAVRRFIRDSVDAGLDVTASVVDVPEVDLVAAAAVAADLGATFRARRLLSPAATLPEGPS